MKRRRWIWVGGGATAALAVAVGVATNQVLDNGRFSWPWLGAALAVALLTVVLDRILAGREAPRDSDLELSAVTLTETGPPEDTSAVLDLKLRNIGDQPALLHRATFHIHDAVNLEPYYLVGFLPYEEWFMRGALSASATYDIALPDPEEAAGSDHDLDLSQAIEPAGTDRFHIRLGIPPTQNDTLIYLLYFDIHYDAHRTLTSPAIAIAHPPGSQLVTPDEIRNDLHDFRRAVREVRDAIDREMTIIRGLSAPDWDNHPPTSRADLPANLRSVDGGDLPFSMPGAYKVNDAFWDPGKSITQRLNDIRTYCARVVSIISGADISHDSLPFTLGEAQVILDQLPALEAEFSTPERATTAENPRSTPDVIDKLLRLLGGPPLQELRALAEAGEQDAVRQLDAAAGQVGTIQRLGMDHPEALRAREVLIFWLAALDRAGGAVALAELISDQVRIQGPDHPHTLEARHHLARCRGETGDAAAAAAEFDELVADRTRVLGPDHPDTLHSRHALVVLRAMSGDPARAVPLFAEIVADQTRVEGPEHPHTLHARHNEAVCRGKAGDPAGAATALAEVVADRARVLGPDHPDTVTSKRELARWEGRAGEDAASAG